MKYKKGEFGYWWTVERGKKDIEGKEVTGVVDCSYCGLTSLRGAPAIANGYFGCAHNDLPTLKFAPKIVKGCFACNNNKLRYLLGGPKIVFGVFDCSGNELTSLCGAPKTHGSEFNCSNNRLTSLEWAPETRTVFNCSNNRLTSLKGAPKYVCIQFDCSYNRLRSLRWAPEGPVKHFNCRDNRLTSLRGAPRVVTGTFYCCNNRLATLTGAPVVVGEFFTCNNNKLLAFYHTFESSIQNFSCRGNTALHHLPDNFEAQRISGDAYSWRGSTWSFFDGVQKEVATIRKSGSITVYKMKDGTYAVHDGEAYSHGETLKEAKADLIYKRTSRNLSAYESLTMNSKLPLAECIKMYRSITGACSLGTKEFCSRRKLKKAYTVREVIELTDGAYGNDILRSFFAGKRW